MGFLEDCAGVLLDKVKFLYSLTLVGDSTFDDVSNVVILADKCSVNGSLNAQLLFHRLGVTFQVGVWLSNFVNKDLVILRRDKRNMHVSLRRRK